MTSHLLDTLTALAARVGEGVSDAFGATNVETITDAELVDALRVAGQALRHIERAVVELVGEAASRTDTGDRAESLCRVFSCHNLSELVQKITLVAPHTAARWAKAARTVQAGRSLTGEPLPPQFPEMREALRDGFVGVDGLLAATGPLVEAARRADPEAFLTADTEMAAVARGEGMDGSPPACADVLRVHATVWATMLDPDGSKPSEREALRHRGITLGMRQGDLIPVRGLLMAEVAAQLQRIFDADGSPRTNADTHGVRFRPDPDPGSILDADPDDVSPRDDRTPTQRRHDSFATALFAAARSQLLPTIGGAAPTLMVTVREEDLATGRGWAHTTDTTQPLPIGAAAHTACTGAVQRVVLNEHGRVVELGTQERIFNKHQRRAIEVRDGGCIIPGCGTPAAWCEIHHVVEHHKCGPTHTDNGVMLCWYHHRFIDDHGWGIRIRDGIPEVKAPGWHDPSGRWRPTANSHTRITNRINRRT